MRVIPLRLVVPLLLVLPCAEAAAAPAPAGPRLATVEMIEPNGFRPGFDRDPVLSIALATVDPSEAGERRLLRVRLGNPKAIAPAGFGPPAWSADGSLIVFSGARGEAGGKKIFAVPAAGGRPRPLPRTDNGANPVLSPDGTMLAFSRSRYRFRVAPGFLEDPVGFILNHPNVDPFRTYSSTTTWILDLAGGKPRRLTRWRDGLANTPSSFSPDGAFLLVTNQDDRLGGTRVMRLGLADSSVEELLPDAREAAFSPDGTRIAFTGFRSRDVVEAEENHDYLAADLYVANADGSGVRRLSRSKGVLESSPSWDPSGQRIAYVQFRGDTSFVPGLGNLFPFGNALMHVNADGRCRGKITTLPNVAFYGVAWQPGPGREAGPLSC